MGNDPQFSPQRPLCSLCKEFSKSDLSIEKWVLVCKYINKYINTLSFMFVPPLQVKKVKVVHLKTSEEFIGEYNL